MLELLLSSVIAIILLSLIAYIGKSAKRRALKAKCISQMRVIHTAFASHLVEEGHWPQILENVDGELSEDKVFKFWVESLEPYGANQDTWICPSDKLYREWREDDDGKYFGSYIPTPFDRLPATPLRWNQPWFIERGDFHGKGAHMAMPDGSIQESQNPFYGR